MHTSKSSIHPETPIIVLKSIFQRYDADGDGLLNPLEFGKALEDLDINDETEQRALFALADANNSKTVHLDDFINLIKSNDFELILSSPEDYEFMIETYKAFQQYDQNADGQITWDEFYFYLTKHGYSHQYISQYWYCMDVERKLTVSFEGFWKGFKLQANAIKPYEVQQEVNPQIVDKHTKKRGMHSKVLHRASLIDSHSWSQSDKDNIFEYLKTQLKPTKVHQSAHGVALGRVLDTEEDDVSHTITTNSLRICCNSAHSKQPLSGEFVIEVAHSKQPLCGEFVIDEELSDIKTVDIATTDDILRHSPPQSVHEDVSTPSPAAMHTAHFSAMIRRRIDIKILRFQH